MKTQTKKKRLGEKIFTLTPAEKNQLAKRTAKMFDSAIKDPQPYELFQLKNKTWKWRKRAKNRAILNHQYNTKAAAIKGMKADYAVTVAMESFEYREVKR